MWRAFWNDGVTEENHFLRFTNPNSVAYWGTSYSNAQQLYVRPEYDRLWNLIFAKNVPHSSFVVRGTKGTGKTLFMSYIIYRIVKETEASAMGSASESTTSNSASSNPVSYVFPSKSPVILMVWKTSGDGSCC